MIKESTRKIRLTGTTPILATYPAEKDLYTRFIASKCESDSPDEGEQTFEEREAQSLSIFPTDEDGSPIILGYQIKGYLKEAILNLSSQNGIKAGRKKVDNFVFIEPARIRFFRDGNAVEKTDGRCERPLMSNVMGKEYTSIKSSEQILAPWEITFTIRLVENAATKTSKNITWDAISDALDYGRNKGLLQWRNAGYGQFTWKEVAE